MPKSENNFKKFVSKTNIYLAIIAILEILLCIKDPNYIAPSVVIFALLIISSNQTCISSGVVNHFSNIP